MSIHSSPGPSWRRRFSRHLQKARDHLRRQLGLWLFDRPLSGVPGGLDLRHCQRVLLIRWDAKMGDAIVASFLFRELRRLNPAVQIDVVTVPAMESLFRDVWHADKIYLCQKRPSYHELANLAMACRGADLMVHFSQQIKPKDLFFIKRVQPRYLAGLDDTLQCVNLKLAEACRGQHFADKFAYLLQQGGLDPVDTRYLLPIAESSEQAVEAAWPLGYAGWIALNPFGASKSRKLNRDTVRRLVGLIHQRWPAFGVCLLYPPAERAFVNELQRQLADPALFFYAASRSIQDVVAQIRRCDALISVDTATVHIAAGLQKPLLGLYNPDMTNFADWGPNNPQAVCVFSHAPVPYDINALDWSELDHALEQLNVRQS